VAKPRSVIHVVRAKEPRHLLRDVIHLVRDTARCDEEPEPAGSAAPNPTRDALVGFVPGYAPEAPVAVLPQQRIRQPAQFPQLGIIHRAQQRQILQLANVERRHGVQPKQIQAGHAQVGAFDGPVVKPRDPQRAPIAHALAQYLPGIAEIVAVLPDDAEHVTKVLGFGPAQPEGNGGFELVGKTVLNAV
jgi:hypothetical protein